MNKPNKFSPEVKERAVRLVQEHRGEYPSLWAAVESAAPKFGCVPQTLLEWVKRTEIPSGSSQSVTSCRLPRQPTGAMRHGSAIQSYVAIEQSATRC